MKTIVEGWARALRIKAQYLVHLHRGALLHDIGKMGIPAQILLKPGPLTEKEWEIMKKHPTYPWELLSLVEYFRPARIIKKYGLPFFSQ